MPYWQAPFLDSLHCVMSIVNLMHECMQSLSAGMGSQVKRNHAGLSDQLLRIVRALDALEGRFAEQSHHHNSKTHQILESLSQDLAHLETVLAPNSAGKDLTP